MKWWEVLIHFICISFGCYGYIKSYSKIFDIKAKNNRLLSIVVIFVVSILTFCNTFYNFGNTRIIISFFLLTIMFKIIFSDEYSKVILKGLVVYILSVIVEIFLGFLSVILNVNDVMQFNKIFIMKVLFSLLITLTTMLFSFIKPTKKVLNNAYKIITNKKILVFLTFLLFGVIIIITGSMFKKINFYSYALQYLIILIFLIFFFVLLKQMLEINKVLEKEQILLEFIEKYERLIDNDRINKHETINNLLILKSIKNKNSKEYDRILEDMLISYKCNGGFKGIYNLPPGLKGIIYYKLFDAEDLQINVNINISNKVITKIEKINTSNFSKLCKIIGILLENAKEASKEAINKEILIDIYDTNFNSEIIIYIENTFNGQINISKINQKNYSTKGKHRGLGLYIVQDLLCGNDNIKLSQEIKNDKFISIIKIKN